MVDRNRNIFVVNDAQNRHRITQQWSLHAQVTLSNGKPEGRGLAYQRGNIVFSCKPPGAAADSGYGSRSPPSPPSSYRRSNAGGGGFTHSQQYSNNQFRRNQQSFSTNERFSNSHHYASSSQQDFDKKCFNSCKVTVDCDHHNGSDSLFPGTHHTFTVTTGNQSHADHLSPGHPPQEGAGLCEICSGVGSHSPTTARRRDQFTSHFCTRVPEKRRSRDASIQTSFTSVPDVLVEVSLPGADKTTQKLSNGTDGQSKVAPIKNITKSICEDATVDNFQNSDDKKAKSKPSESTSPTSPPCTEQAKPHSRQKVSKEPCPLTKLKRQTLSSGSLRKSPNLLMHSSTGAVQKYATFLSPKPFRKAPTTPTNGTDLTNCDTITPKPEPENKADSSAPAKSWRTSKSKIDPSASVSSKSLIKDESLDSLKNGCDSGSDLSRSDTGSSCSTISCSDCSYSTDSMSDTSSSTLEDLSRSDSFEYADSFEYDDSFDKLRIEEKEKTWRKKAGNTVEGSASKDQIRHQKFADYLTKRSTTSPFPSWKSSTVSISTVCSEDDSSSSSSSSSISDDGSMSELGWSFASKCNNPTRLNSLNSVTSAVFEKQNSSRKLGPQKMDSLDSGSYSDSSQQTFCSQISVGRREASLPRQIPSANSSFSKAEKFGPVVNSLRKPGHHIGPSKNPNCSCATCVAHFDANETGKAKASRNESFDSFHDSDCGSGLDCDPTCGVVS